MISHPIPERDLARWQEVFAGARLLKAVKSTSLPASDAELLRDDGVPYFLWWADVTVGEFRRLLTSADVRTRAYWLGALLREANTRDVWQFVAPLEVRRFWPQLLRHLGRRREVWAYLLGLPPPVWPPVVNERG